MADNSSIKDNNGKNIVYTTDSNGKYELTGLKQGQYMVVFEYNTEKYAVTKYQVEGISNSNNSDAIRVSKIIDGQEKNVAVTDTLNVQSNLSNIDLGLFDNANINLKLTKTVKNITVTNKEGTKKYKFKNSNLAKVEIPSKYLSGSNVVIEYSIKIENTGDIEAYANNIIDYIPSSLTFVSSLNKDWYKKGKNLYNSSLSNTPIKPGKTKEVTLILTKKMTSSNTGLVNNKAKIESVFTSSGEKSAKDDISSADVIISIKTGETVIYGLFILITLLITLGMVYGVKKIVIKVERR